MVSPQRYLLLVLFFNDLDVYRLFYSHIFSLSSLNGKLQLHHKICFNFFLNLLSQRHYQLQLVQPWPATCPSSEPSGIRSARRGCQSLIMRERLQKVLLCFIIMST